MSKDQGRKLPKAQDTRGSRLPLWTKPRRDPSSPTTGKATNEECRPDQGPSCLHRRPGQPDKNAVGTAREPRSTDSRVQTNNKRTVKEIRELWETVRYRIQAC